MKWIKFIVISTILLPLSHHASACADMYTPEHAYMFSVYNHNLLTAWDRKINDAYIAFWNTYFNDVTLKEPIQSLINGSVDATTSIKDIIRYAQRHKDTDAQRYFSLMLRMNTIGPSNAWDYPSKAKIAADRRTWLALLADATGRISTSKRLASRYWLMAIRAAYYTGNRVRCTQLWNQYQARFTDDYIRDVAQGYLASYWFKSGQREKAREYYAKVGDLQSLRWCFSRNIGIKGIKDLYAETPNSVAFPYLIQDYVNSLDNDWAWNSFFLDGDANNVENAKARRAQLTEINAFRTFALQVIKSGKVKNPALWQSAMAFTAYIKGSYTAALNEIKDAQGMEGTDRMKDNARAIRFLIESDATKYSSYFDEYVLGEMRWLVDKAKTEETFTDFQYPNYSVNRNHYSDVMQRVVLYHLTPGYIKAGQKATGALLTGMVNEFYQNDLCKRSHHLDKPSDMENDSTFYQGLNDYNNDLFALLDTIPVKEVEDYAQLIAHPEKGTELQQYAASFCYKNLDYLNEIIGTKYLRADKFEEAAAYLKKVSLDFISAMNIAPYMHADMTYPVWFNWKSKAAIKASRYLPGKMTSNPKLLFCEKMINLKQRLALATDPAEKANIYYDLATEYLEASPFGNCWMFTNYAWTSAQVQLKHPTAPFYTLAYSCLNKAMQADNGNNNTVRCLFALAHLATYTDPWIVENGYDAKTDKTIYKIQWKAEQTRLFAQLYNLKSTAGFDKYGLSTCDNLTNYFDHRK